MSIRITSLSKSVLTAALCLGFSLTAKAQGFASLIFPEKSITYLGQTGRDGKERNGIGLLRLKNDEVYAGDFSRGKSHGYGILISAQNKSIKDCGDASIYVGRWFRGKKEGKGSLYNSDGNLIYNGTFAEDKPVNAFFAEPDTIHRFTVLELDDELFIGEVVDYIPQGYGIFTDDEGFITFCQSNNGLKNGIGLMVCPPSPSWAVFDIKNDLYYPIETSNEQSERRQAYKTNRDIERAALLQTFANLLQDGVQLANNFQDVLNNSTGGSQTEPQGENTSAASSASGGSGRGSSTSGGKYNMSEQQAYNSDKATYAKYDSLLAAVFAGNREASSSEIKNWQSKMKSIREKWAKKGKTIPQAANETR